MDFRVPNQVIFHLFPFSYAYHQLTNRTNFLSTLSRAAGSDFNSTRDSKFTILNMRQSTRSCFRNDTMLERPDFQSCQTIRKRWGHHLTRRENGTRSWQGARRRRRQVLLCSTKSGAYQRPTPVTPNRESLHLLQFDNVWFQHSWYLLVSGIC